MKPKTTDEETLAQTRKKFFEESRFDPTNQKFGLFSYPGTLAISDKPYFTKTACHKNPEGKVDTKPSNFLTNPAKRGKTPNVYFSSLPYKSDGSIQTNKPYLADKLRDEERKKYHDLAWKPGGALAEPLSLFPHEPSETIKKINKRGEDGLVELGPRNLYTAPAKEGGAMVTPGLLIGGKAYEYVGDPYDRKQQILKAERLKNRMKMQSEVFKPPNPSGRNFFDDKTTYAQVVIKPKTMKKSSTEKHFKHSAPFLPSNPGKAGCTIGKYPEHMADPLASPKRRPPSEQIPWRPSTNYRTRPTPSIINLASNLRSEFTVLRKNN